MASPEKRGAASDLRCPRCGVGVPRPGAFVPVAGSPLPFCSQRCRMADLDRWFTEDYRLPVTDEPGGEE